jgi:hypothetical protein
LWHLWRVIDFDGFELTGCAGDGAKILGIVGLGKLAFLIREKDITSEFCPITYGTRC